MLTLLKGLDQLLLSLLDLTTTDMTYFQHVQRSAKHPLFQTEIFQYGYNGFDARFISVRTENKVLIDYHTLSECLVLS